MTSYSISKWGLGALLGVSFWGFTIIGDASAQQGRRRGNGGQAQTQTQPAAPSEGTASAKDGAKDNPKQVAKGPAPVVLPADWTKSLKWRELGPATMSGRITAISVHPKDPTLWYVATASGGLLKTVNNGNTFEHLFDKESTISIGDVCVAPSDPNLVWIGTGEANPRNSVSMGDGVYKSTDGGKTWKNMGLKSSFQIGKVIVHPTNPDIVYVGALGRLYGPGGDRGVFKTTDGGKTWNRIHFIDDKTGVIDMVMHPTEPDTLLVATWDRMRDGFDSWPGEVKIPDGYDGYDPIPKWGPNSAIFKTSDGGTSWKKITAGIPSGKLGRIGLTWHEKNPNILYSIIDTENIGKGLPPITTYLGANGRDLPGKVEIIQVIKDSPAGKAGILKGDHLLAIGEKQITKFADLIEDLRPRKSGDKITLKIRRGAEEKTIEIALAGRPGAAPQGGPGGPGGGGRGGPGGGARPAPIDAYAGIFGQDGEGAAKITQVTDGGPAEKADLEVGDLITSVDGKKIASYAEFTESLRPKKPEDKVKLSITRGEKKLEVEVTLETRPGAPDKKRPNTGQLGGQNQNIQDMQGGNGHEFGGVYRSEDGGESWIRVNSLNPRPMYFSSIKVDPMDDTKVYVMGVSQHASTDGGATFNDTFGRNVHADGHALWISKTNGRHMVTGGDGGVYQTYDAGANWDHLNHVAIGQFYHVDISPEIPYRVAGGLQDNGSWALPGLSQKGGVINEDVISLGGGDGYTCRFDPNDPDIAYYTSQNGGMARRNLKTGSLTPIRPVKPKGQKDSFRFNWNTPYFLSKHNSKVFYAGSQFVMRSFNRGDDLRAISPELTVTKRGSMSTMSESPRNPDIFWAGTDDGALWVTKNGGRDWTNVTANLGLGQPKWVSMVEASKYADGRAYVTLDAHRSNDDASYVFVTEDFGATFKRIESPAITGWVRSVREDIKNENLLYCGTEFGFVATLDRGTNWFSLNTNLPKVAVHEIAQHPILSEIVVATHGRSLWALEVGALRQLGAESLKDQAKLYKPSTAIRWQPQPRHGGTNRKFVATNPPTGAQIAYSLPKKAESVEVRVYDVEGNNIRTVRGGVEPGLNIVAWDLLQNTQNAPGRRPEGGPGMGAGAGRRPGGAASAATPPAAPATVPAPPAPGTPPVQGTPTVPAAGSPPAAPPAPGAAPVAPPGTGQRPPGGGQGRQGGGRGAGGAGAGGFTPGRAVLPGTYKVVLVVDGKELVTTVRVENDPSAPPPPLTGEENAQGDWSLPRLPKYPD